MRDKWKDQVYFNNLIGECEKLAKENYSKEKRARFASISLEKECNLINRSSGLLLDIVKIKYTNGGSFKEVFESYELYLERLFEAHECFQSCRKNTNGTWLEADIVSTVVYADCLGFDKNVLSDFSHCIQPSKDQLVDRLLSHYQPDRPISDVLKEKGKYKQLIEIMDSDDKAFQAKKLKNYLNQWPKKLRGYAPDGPFPLHEMPTYDGYWCYEACAVVIVCDIDDEGFKDHEFYPAELMSWRKK